MGKRQVAMKWWRSLSHLRKTQICDTHTELIGSVRRWETLTGREIEALFDYECAPKSENEEDETKNRGRKGVRLELVRSI